MGGSGALLGWSWGVLGRSWGRPWGVLGDLETILERHGTSWGGLGASWGALGAILGPLGAILGRLEATKNQSKIDLRKKHLKHRSWKHFF